MNFLHRYAHYMVQLACLSVMLVAAGLCMSHGMDKPAPAMALLVTLGLCLLVLLGSTIHYFKTRPFALMPSIILSLATLYTGAQLVHIRMCAHDKAGIIQARKEHEDKYDKYGTVDDKEIAEIIKKQAERKERRQNAQ